MTDRDLLRRYANDGSEVAFTELVRRHGDAVWSICFRVLGSRAAADDGTQATFLVLARKARSLSADVIIAGWLIATARHCALDIRKAAIRRARAERSAAVMNAAQTPATPIATETLALLDECLTALSPRMRSVITLRYLQRRSQTETATEMNCAEHTVSALLSRALARLQQKMSRRGASLTAVALVEAMTLHSSLPAPAQTLAQACAVATGKTAASVAVAKTADVVVARGLIGLKALLATSILAFSLGATALAINSWRQHTAGAVVPLQQAAQTAPGIDLRNLPANTWVRLPRPRVVQPQGAPRADPGYWAPKGLNKLVYDTAGHQVLFFDRWADARGGGAKGYPNCLFAYDPVAGKLTPLNTVNWADVQGSGRTRALAENTTLPTPCPRFVHNAFDYAADLKAVFICNGANSGAMQQETVLGHKLCENTWRLDLPRNAWTRVTSPQHPDNSPLDAALAYCPDIKSLVYCNAGQLWILDLPSGHWRRAKVDAPGGGYGQTICYDPLRGRMLLIGGAGAEVMPHDTAAERNVFPSRAVYAFEPRSETVTALADCPTPLFEAHLAYDSKRDLFITANASKSGPHATGTFSYDPKRNTWSRILTTNATPDSGYWNGWVRLCYAPDLDCFIALVCGKDSTHDFYALRCAP